MSYYNYKKINLLATLYASKENKIKFSLFSVAIIVVKIAWYEENNNKKNTK